MARDAARALRTLCARRVEVLPFVGNDGGMRSSALRSLALVPFALVLLAVVPVVGQEAISRAIHRAEERGWSVHCAAHRLSDGAPIALWRAQDPAIPASTQKLLVAAGALHELGAEHRILTDVLAHGSFENGVLAGPLRLRGEADPTLSWEDFLDETVAAATKVGLKEVQGDLLIDEGRFAQPARGPEWPGDEPANDWLAFPAAVMPRAGTIVFDIRGPERFAIASVPAGLQIALESELRGCRKTERPEVAIRRDPTSDRFVLHGRVQRGPSQRHAAAVADAPLLAGQALKAALEAAGVQVRGTVRRLKAGEALADEGRLLHRFETPMTDLFPAMLKNSDNPTAEALAAHWAVARGREGSYAGVGEVLTAFVAQGGTDVEERLVPRDGSGLSRGNRISAGLFAQVLVRSAGGELGAALRAHLPTGGEKGTTLRHARYKPFGERLLAKTGSLRDVVALAGFLEPKVGEPLAFAILMKSEKAGSTERNAMRDLSVQLVSAFDRGVFGR